MYIYLIVC